MKPIFTRSLNGGTQEVYRFENNFGASVIRGGSYAYGGHELAVVKFVGLLQSMKSRMPHQLQMT